MYKLAGVLHNVAEWALMGDRSGVPWCLDTAYCRRQSRRRTGVESFD